MSATSTEEHRPQKLISTLDPEMVLDPAQRQRLRSQQAIERFKEEKAARAAEAERVQQRRVVANAIRRPPPSVEEAYHLRAAAIKQQEADELLSVYRRERREARRLLSRCVAEYDGLKESAAETADGPAIQPTAEQYWQLQRRHCLAQTIAALNQRLERLQEMIHSAAPHLTAAENRTLRGKAATEIAPRVVASLVTAQFDHAYDRLKAMGIEPDYYSPFDPNDPILSRSAATPASAITASGLESEGSWLPATAEEVTADAVDPLAQQHTQPAAHTTAAHILPSGKVALAQNGAQLELMLRHKGLGWLQQQMDTLSMDEFHLGLRGLNTLLSEMRSTKFNQRAVEERQALEQQRVLRKLAAWGMRSTAYPDHVPARIPPPVWSVYPPGQSPSMPPESLRPHRACSPGGHSLLSTSTSPARASSSALSGSVRSQATASRKPSTPGKLQPLPARPVPAEAYSQWLGNSDFTSLPVQ
eukprot:GGOE01008255.1.p1 GENE.GGOE01008255.1~~GGOE01008255.1.p1  ORF type:complete len:496 (-),score=148.40 GGOE01008255.1:477-1898(-)